MVLKVIFTRTIENKRCFSTTSKLYIEQQAIRVRFAPSPTGHIHLGGLRAALYNYIFAKQNNGQFILRIEDTDRTRVVSGSAEEIEDVLNWAGLKPDESPRVGGLYGPYVQSSRLKLYVDRAHELLEQGKAYRCFCSPARLELLRKYQSRNREKPHYDGKCRHLTSIEIKDKLEENGSSHVIRFALKEGETIFNDLVFGSIRNNLIDAKESDPIILKSDLYPTYHFASVVDDNSMKITNVIRGAEWISSTAKHVQIYQGFGWRPPQFIHFPLITMEDGAKMSKRCNHSHVREWIDAGYRPTAILNFLTNTGGGVPKEKQDLMQLWTLDQFIRGFDFREITSHAGSLDMNRLRVYSSKELRMAWRDDPDKLIIELFELLQQNNIQCDLNHDLAKTIVGNLIDRIWTLKDLFASDYLFIWHHPRLTWSKQEYLENNWNLDEIVSDTIDTMQKVNLDDRVHFSQSLKELCKRHEINYSEYMKFMRKLLINSDKGLPIFEIVQCLGQHRLIEYLRKGLSFVREPE